MSPAEDPKPAGEESQRPTVLLVEDEVLLRLALAAEFRAGGFNVVEAANGDEGRNLVLAGIPVDIVVADITMPGRLDGAEFALWLKDYGLPAPIILTSGLPAALERARARCPHVKAFVAKPYPHDKVVAQVQALLAARD
jgi:CheY-like chemotaxis protein